MTEEPADIWVVNQIQTEYYLGKKYRDPDTGVGYDILPDYGTYIISGVIKEYNDASQIWLVELDSRIFVI